MPLYRGRRAATIDNGRIRVTALEEGGHIAEIRDIASDVSPLWSPHWPSIEPSQYDPARHPIYGGGADASLLAGLIGHNLCLDIFGGPSPEEAAAGLPAHGETSVARFAIDVSGQTLTMETVLPAAQLRLTRRIALDDRVVRFHERGENLTAIDRPVGWTQHVTMGPPFLERGGTQFRLSADRSLVYPGTFGPAHYLRSGAEFRWPDAPAVNGGTVDMRTYTQAASSSAYTAHRVDVSRERGSFVAYSPALKLAFGYSWRREDFPWVGVWEENRARPNAPWNGQALTCGFEFGVSPIPESRREMLERGRLFDTPTFRWLPARTAVEVEYCAVLRPAEVIPDSLGC